MRYTPRLLRTVLSVVIVLLLLLSIASSAAYRVRTATVISEHSVCSDQIISKGEGKPSSDSVFRQRRRLVERREDTHHNKLTSAELALMCGTIGTLFLLLGLSILHGVGGSISSLSALIGVGMFGILTPSIMGIIAILYGIKGLRTKKRRAMAIIGLVPGIVSLASAIAIAL